MSDDAKSFPYKKILLIICGSIFFLWCLTIASLFIFREFFFFPFPSATQGHMNLTQEQLAKRAQEQTLEQINQMNLMEEQFKKSYQEQKNEMQNQKNAMQERFRKRSQEMGEQQRKAFE